MSLFLYLHKNNCFHSLVIWRVRNLDGPGIGKWRVQVRDRRGTCVTVGVLWYVTAALATELLSVDLNTPVRKSFLFLVFCVSMENNRLVPFCGSL